MAMGFNKNNKFQKSFSTETVHLGTFIHPAEDLLVLKLESQGIPYPNSPVIYKEKQIGKVEEVFGQFNDPYVAVKLEGGKKIQEFRLETKFEGYKEKFIPKDRFLPREEVEKRKEMQDKKSRGINKKPFDKGRNFKDNKGKFNNRPNDRKFNDRKNDRNSQDRWSKNKSQGNDKKNKKTKFD